MGAFKIGQLPYSFIYSFHFWNASKIIVRAGFLQPVTLKSDECSSISLGPAAEREWASKKARRSIAAASRAGWSGKLRGCFIFIFPIRLCRLIGIYSTILEPVTAASDGYDLGMVQEPVKDGCC